MKQGLRQISLVSVAGTLLLGLTAAAQADVRLLAITGNAEINPAHDQSLYSVDPTDPNSTPQFIQQLTLGKDTSAIGWNPMDNLLFRTVGDSAWTDDPNRRAGGWPYRDEQYAETVDVDTGALTAVYNANGPNLPDPDNFFTPVGLAAPRPSWIYPQTARSLAQTNNDFRSLLNVGTGPNEFSTIRDHAWSQSEQVFYVSGGTSYRTGDLDTDGNPIQVRNDIFRLTPDGQSTAIGNTGIDNLKGLTFYHPVPGQTVLLGSQRDGNLLYTINPADASLVGDPVEVNLVDENGTVIGPSGGLLGLTQDPVTGDLLGINHSDDTATRELLKIDPVTGNAETIGLLRTDPDTPDAGFAGIAFVGYRIGDMDQNGNVDFDDIAAFIQGLNDPAGYEAAFGVPNTLSGDTDGNGRVDFDDISGFVGLLNAGNGSAATVPEPASIVLLGLGLLGLMGLRRRRR